MRILFRLSLLLAFALAACEGATTTSPFDEQRNRETVFGTGGLSDLNSALLGGDDEENAPGASGVPVNAYLWRAALDTVNFMPLASADPFGGVIITDWHAPVSAPGERFKLNIVVLSRQLVADGVRARVFKQRRGDAAEWIDAPVDPSTNSELEDAILTRARELRIASVAE